MPTRSILKFGPFELDPSLGELRKDGVRIPIQEKPLLLLLALLERQGDLVTRAELHQRLWHDETFVDFDTGLNTAVRKLRAALGDESESPRYIETIPGAVIGSFTPCLIPSQSSTESRPGVTALPPPPHRRRQPLSVCKGPRRNPSRLLSAHKRLASAAGLSVPLSWLLPFS